MGSKKVKRKVKASKRDKYTKKKHHSVKKRRSDFSIKKCQLLKSFPQTRDNYFKYLQNVIRDNLKTANKPNVPNDSLEEISLEVEQPALLACMQAEIYRQIMMKIIHDIKNSTQQKKLHLGIKKILLSKNFEDTEILPRVKKEPVYDISNKCEEATNEEVYSHIPTISSVRANSNELNQGWSVQNLFQDEYGSFVDVDNLPCQTETLPNKSEHGPLSVSCEAQDIMQAVYSPSTGEQYVSLYNNNSPKFLPPVVPAAENGQLNESIAKESNHAYISSNLVPIKTILHSEENYNVNQNKTVSISRETEISNNEVIPSFKPNSGESTLTLKPQNHVQKQLQAPEIKGPDIERKDERERPERTKVEDASENETEMSDTSSNYYYDDSYDRDPKHVGLLADRLEQMRRLFGMGDDEEKKNTKKSKHDSKNSEPDKSTRIQKSHKKNEWYHQKIMNMYRLSRMISELTPVLRREKRDKLVIYFGEDSDEENETSYVQEEKFLLSCKERISHWVVKYLMPYYQSGRIIGRNVFKILGHHVSNSVIYRTSYPDEWTVKYVVSKYFAGDKSFFSESDVLCYQPDL